MRKTNLKSLVRVGLPLSVGVKAALEAEGKTIRAWAYEMGLNETSVSALLGGSARTELKHVREALCDYFDVSPKWLDANL